MTNYLEKKNSKVLLVFVIFLLSLGCKNISKIPVAKIDKGFIEKFKSNKWTIRRDAVRIASKYNDVSAENVILRALDDSHNAVIIEALKAIEKKPIKKAELKVKAIAEKTNNKNVKWHAIKALGSYQNPKNIYVFSYNLLSDDWLIREASIIGFLKIKDVSIKKKYIYLILRALNDKSTSVKISTLKHLNFYHELLYNKIINILKKSCNENNIFLIKYSLKALKGYKIKKQDMEILISLLGHRDKEIRILAFRILKSAKSHARAS